MKSVTVKEGSEITLTANAFTKTGYTFSEWNTKADGNGKDYEAKAKVKLTANTTLYAQWTANNYTVTFDKNANDATGDAPADIPATYDKEFELPENIFKKIGYNFDGWNTEKAGSGKNYEANTKVKNLTAENNATVTLYAKWTDRGTHKISYELNGGNHIGTQIEQFKETEDVTFGTAERTGYAFGGWHEAEDCSGTAVASWKAGEITADVTLYAKWTVNTYIIKYELDGGTNAAGNPESYTIETETVELKDPTKEGFTFVCWYSDRSKKTEIAKGSTGDIVLQAVWKNDVNFVKVPAVSIKGSENWTPESKVFISGRTLNLKAFWMSDHEVTQAEWKEVMDGNLPENMASTDGTADNNPVNMVNWYDAIVYCNKRSIKENLTPCYKIKGYTDTNSRGNVPTFGNDTSWDAATCDFEANGYRLPTEAEWEWAARGGENYTYAGSEEIEDVAWYRGTSESKTYEVKTLKSNGYGLYDMSGNVIEWCWDWYNSISSSTPEAGASSGAYRVRRGGCWYYFDSDCGVAYRDYSNPEYRGDDYGFRVVRTAE